MQYLAKHQWLFRGKNRIIMAVVLVLFCLVGCNSKEISVNEPVIQLIAQVAISQYIEKNPSSVSYILEVNEIMQSMEYGTIMGTDTIVGLKNKFLKKALVGKTIKEKREILLFTNLIFALAKQQLKVDASSLVEPEFFETIKLLCGLAAETAQLYEILEKE